MFRDKKILVIVPHQDDEINIAGGYISRFSKNNEVFVLYATNGDYIYNAKTRIMECYESCKTLGVDEKHIWFLGYSDQYSDGRDHLYMTNKLWISKNGYSETYMPFDKQEVSKRYKNKHNEFNKDNFVADIRLVIEKLLPDVLVCIDFDSHCDHRATSLAFEHALGEVLNKKKNYTPLVYKGFAYPTAYFGDNDFDSMNIKSTGFNTEPHSYAIKENPYYIDEKPVRFALENDCIERRLWKNRIFRALKCHKSQIICKRAKSIINSDQLYYQRRTNNLLYESDIEASSGDASRLHDFVLFDCENIMKGNSLKPVLSDCAWVPEEGKPFVNISFKKKTKISEIRLYNSANSNKDIEFDLLVDDKKYNHYIFKDKYVNKILFEECLQCKKISFIFANQRHDLSLSELEVFEYKDSHIEEIVAEIDGDIAYNYYFDEDFKLNVLSYDGIIQDASDTGLYDFYINGKKMEYSEFAKSILKRRNIISICLKSDNAISASFGLIKKNRIDTINNKKLAICNSIYLFVVVFIQKVNRKLFIKRNSKN